MCVATLGNTLGAVVNWLLGLLLLPPKEPEDEADAALMWLSEAALQQRLETDGTQK